MNARERAHARLVARHLEEAWSEAARAGAAASRREHRIEYWDPRSGARRKVAVGDRIEGHGARYTVRKIAGPEDDHMVEMAGHGHPGWSLGVQDVRDLLQRDLYRHRAMR